MALLKSPESGRNHRFVVTVVAAFAQLTPPTLTRKADPMLRTLIAIIFIGTTFTLGLVAVLLAKDKDDLDPRAVLAALS